MRDDAQLELPTQSQALPVHRDLIGRCVEADRAFEDDATDPARIDVKKPFLVGLVIWSTPALVRYAFGTIETRSLVYGAIWTIALFAVSFATIRCVHLGAMRWGFSFFGACRASIVALLPVIGVAYMVDYLVGQADPTLSRIVPRDPRTLTFTIASAIGDSIAICTWLAALVYLPGLARFTQSRENELELARREAALLRVRAHLEPHFVLNSLNAVSGLVEEDPALARELLAALGDLFREASTFQSEHRVRDEIAWLERYVLIHEVRHPGALKVRWEIDDATRDLVCPALLLQPLVENAIQHGALRGNGSLVVRSTLDGGALVLTVEDDGPDLGLPRNGGRGLAIVRRRLAIEKVASDAFTLAREAGRTVARVTLDARPFGGARA